MKIVDTGKRSGQENMAIDAALLEDIAFEREPILHLYEWDRETASYGHFIDPKKLLKIEGLPLALAKRPTGGGIIFHTTDYAFSFLMPASHPHFSNNPLENYQFVNKQVLRALERMGVAASLLPEEKVKLQGGGQHFCMSKPTIYDVMLAGKKVGGAAQRKTKGGYLHQGSLFLKLPTTPFLESILPEGSEMIEAMQRHSQELLDPSMTLDEGRKLFRTHLIDVMTQCKGL